LEELVQVEFTPEFKRNLRALARKYQHIRSDVQPVIEQLEAGEIIGDKVPGGRGLRKPISGKRCNHGKDNYRHLG